MVSPPLLCCITISLNTTLTESLYNAVSATSNDSVDITCISIIITQLSYRHNI